MSRCPFMGPARWRISKYFIGKNPSEKPLKSRIEAYTFGSGASPSCELIIKTTSTLLIGAILIGFVWKRICKGGFILAEAFACTHEHEHEQRSSSTKRVIGIRWKLWEFNCENNCSALISACLPLISTDVPRLLKRRLTTEQLKEVLRLPSI